MSEDEEALQPSYRPVKPIPFELIQHSGIFLEEKLYTQALDLLLSILTSATPAPTPIFAPLPQHLAVAATFLVHPSTTTRAKTAEEAEAPNAALRLLRLTNTLAGPVSANFGRAFSFTHFETSRRGRRRHDHDEDDEMKPLNLDLGQSASVWSRAEDFWHAVGWAFNCSVLHPQRWKRWHTWLEFMCEVLEDDWAERMRLHAATKEEETPNPKPKDGPQILTESLIVRYIVEGGGGVGSSKTRRIMRAIFADGSPAHVNEFREVFHKELKQPKREAENIKKREVEVNIEQEQYGDYLTNDNDDAGSSQDETDPSASATGKGKRPPRQTKRPRRGTRSAKDPSADDDVHAAPLPNGIDHLGGLPSLALRQRLLHLLSTVSQHLPASFINLEGLYHLFVENIRHLPLSTFQALVSPSVLPYFSAAATTTLCECLLFRMRESGAADSDEEYLSQSKLERCFLPYAASTTGIVDNAKMSIAIEALLMLLDDGGLLKVTPELKAALKKGIWARAEKAQQSRKFEITEYHWLSESADRLRFLVDEVLSEGSS
ncbi:hypothetical protein P170DRAFT_405245 [Aspergillus steynii IBT 23096]|uniref:Uncharacterized protein n=1 Tax=Aspergillus steynii IBT 23096 TaxID=1392250 RepID=A0A2I2GBP5_9EURO|nr:uncharacterized protein P170DRAFT_405245 [Aspergillus steynii IBT 23096]PLB50301.1 hypothetical protein P170DRAFT_405245 [Aspergillus steynii IBT 23096]